MPPVVTAPLVILVVMTYFSTEQLTGLRNICVRVNLIRLTEKGENAFAEHHRFHLNLTEQVCACLQEEEIRQLLATIKTLNKEIF